MICTQLFCVKWASGEKVIPELSKFQEASGLMEARVHSLFRPAVLSYCFLPVLPQTWMPGLSVYALTFTSQFIRYLFRAYHPQLPVSCPLLWTSRPLMGSWPLAILLVPLADLCSEEVRVSLDGNMGCPTDCGNWDGLCSSRVVLWMCGLLRLGAFAWFHGLVHAKVLLLIEMHILVSYMSLIPSFGNQVLAV